ncbi:MAG TPA: radical SAM protein [Candidatus Dormibacteraeota bacterium]|nr:radical SAM protein [Candidatus Dormibacteraeota bacterium]
MTGVPFVWLEITGRCQLSCTHCYADSGPHRDHGSMRREDWERVIDEAAELGAPMVQFIGGEPTLHPDLPGLIRLALDRGLEVEVFSNLVRIRSELWELFQEPGVRLATSYYSADPVQHDAVTGRPSHDRTLANIEEAVRRRVPLRVGVIEVDPAQRAGEAAAELGELGIPRVGVDRLRGVGRGGAGGADQLCGHCADGSLAVMPDGAVYPCIMSRWLPIGDASRTGLGDIHESERARAVRDDLRREFTAVQANRPCTPYGCVPRCSPLICGPGRCGPVMDPPPEPCSPRSSCSPRQTPPA